MSTVAAADSSPASTLAGAGGAVARGGGELLRFVERRLGLTAMGLLVVVTATILVAVGQALPSRAMVLLGYGLVLVMLTSWILGRRKLAIDAERSELPSRVTAGRTVEAEVSLTARRRIAAIVAEETLDDALGQPIRFGIPVLPSGQSIRHGYTFTPQRRGVYDVGPFIAEFSDPFGLTRRRQPIAEPAKIVVHPRTESVMDRITSREWEDPPIRPPVTRPWPSGFEFYGLRDYIPGDDPRRIVWRAVARQDKYLIRESEQGITDRVQLYVDTHAEYHSAGKVSETFERAVTAAASLAVQHLKDGLGVSVDINSERIVTAFRGAGKRIPLLDRMAPLALEPEPFSAAVDRLLVDTNKRAHNIIVTPHITQQAAGRLRLVLERGASLVVVLVLSDDTDPLSIHRAGGLGCAVVEVRQDRPLAASFRHLLGVSRL